MITKDQYFAKPHTRAQQIAVYVLLARVNGLLQEYRDATGEPEDIDPDTGTEIGGAKGGFGDGGFRLGNSTTGRAGSAHRVLPADEPDGAAVDCSDQRNKLDEWLETFERGNGDNSMLEKHGLYREHPSATPTWCHLTDRAPGSGKRTYYP